MSFYRLDVFCVLSDGGSRCDNQGLCLKPDQSSICWKLKETTIRHIYCVRENATFKCLTIQDTRPASLKVASHYLGLATRSDIKNDSSRMSKLTALSHWTWQSVAVGDKTAGTAFAFILISCLFAYSREWSMNAERNTNIVVRRRYFFFKLLAHCNIWSFLFKLW